MSFKLLPAIAVAAALVTSGCNFHFRESPTVETAMQLGPSESGCLAGAGDTLARYFAGTVNAQEVPGLFRCLDHSLQLFSERTRGADPGLYKARELRGFLEKYFLNDKKISDNLLNELMELKRTLLGGSLNSLTLDEVARTRQFFQVLSEQMILLQPYMPLSPEWAIGQDTSVIDAAAAALDTAAQGLGAVLQQSGYAYHFSHLDELRKAIEGMVGTDHSSPIGRGIHERMPLIRAIKAVLIAPPGDRIGGDEWVTFLTTASKWYGLLLRAAHVQMNYESLLTGSGRERMEQIAQDTIGLLDATAARHPDGFIPFSEIDAIIDALSCKELALPCPDPESAAKNRVIIKNVVRAVARRAFGGPDMGKDGREAEGLTRPALMHASQLLERWSEGQHFLEAMFQTLNSEPGNNGLDTLGYFAEELLALNPDDLITHRRPMTAEAIETIRNIIRTTPPMYAADENELTLSTSAPLRRYSFHNLSQLFLYHEFMDLILTGYTEDPDRVRPRPGVTLEEFYTAFKDIEPLGFVYKIFDPTRDNYRMIQTRFREGSLFTYASNGDEYLDIDEGTQLFAFMTSNMNLGNRLHAKILERCSKEPGGKGPLDPFGYYTVAIECFKRQLFGNFDLFMRRLPDMADFYRNLSPEKQKVFRESIEASARLPDASKVYMSSSDSLGYAGVFQYIEALFRRFDVSHPKGYLDVNEARTAFLVYRNAIQQVVVRKGFQDKISPDDYEALFMYLLKFAHPPRSTVGGIASWLWWKDKQHLGLEWKLAADRLTIARIFADISK